MITTPLTSQLLQGVTELEITERGVRPHRLPQKVRERFADPQLTLMEAQPSGVRVAIVTTAHHVTLDVHSTRVTYRGMKRTRGALDVIIDGSFHSTHFLTEGDVVEVDMATGNSTLEPGSVDHITLHDLPVGKKSIEIWLPHNEQVDLVGLHSDAPVYPAARTGPLWLHHGSSISHGSNATHPTGIWPTVAARQAGAQLHNLGFGGSALIDSFMARVIRDTPADLISAKLGINVVNLDAMRLRSFTPAIHGFLDTIRDGHPTTPLLLISPIYCEVHEDTPGPSALDPATLGTDTVRFIATGRAADTAQGRLTLRVIRDAMEQVVDDRADDPNLLYLDGRALYGKADVHEYMLPDGLHPSTETHGLIGRRFADLAFAPGGAFATPDLTTTRKAATS